MPAAPSLSEQAHRLVDFIHSSGCIHEVIPRSLQTDRRPSDSTIFSVRPTSHATMSRLLFNVAVFGLAITQTSCLAPHPDYLQDARMAHHARASLRKRVDNHAWELSVYSGSMFLLLMAFGLIGGALEYLLCTRRRRAATHTDGSRVGFGFSGTPVGSPNIGSPQERPRTAKSVSTGRPASRGRVDEKLGRYSWRDDTGITTEVYMDGKVPGAGPPPSPRREKSRGREQEARPSSQPRARSQSRPRSRAPRDSSQHRGKIRKIQPGVATLVSPISPAEPQFAVHYRQTYHEYREEMANNPKRVTGYYGSALSAASSSSSLSLTPWPVSPAEPTMTGGRSSLRRQDDRATTTSNMPRAPRASLHNPFEGFESDIEAGAPAHNTALGIEDRRDRSTARLDPSQWLRTGGSTPDRTGTNHAAQC